MEIFAIQIKFPDDQRRQADLPEGQEEIAHLNDAHDFFGEAVRIDSAEAIDTDRRFPFLLVGRDAPRAMQAGKIGPRQQVRL